MGMIIGHDPDGGEIAFCTGWEAHYNRLATGRRLFGESWREEDAALEHLDDKTLRRLKKISADCESRGIAEH